MNGPRIAIVGGGIGGMALALSLHDAGLTDIDVYEAASSTRELGVGINVLPHAVRELAELGVLPELERSGVAPTQLAYYTGHGQRIWAEPRGRAAGYRWPQLSIHRGRLLGTLARATEARLGPDRIHHAHALTAIDDTGPPVTVRFRDRSDTAGDDVVVEADVVVGCDGVHSATRAALVPNEGPPNWNGITMWRGVTEAEPFLGGSTMIMAGHFARRIVVYPIASDPTRPDRMLVNWVAEYRGDDGRPMPPQDWDHTVDLDEVLAVFGDHVFDFLDFPSLVRGADDVFQYPMVDRDPLASWTTGGVTLLGDAAHPMYPVGSNGASQAIVDARVLAAALATAESTERALDEYESERRPATAAVVLANREVGPERCMELAHERAPDGFDRIDDVFEPGELEQIAAEYKETAGFDVHELNSRPSRSVRRAP